MTQGLLFDDVSNEDKALKFIGQRLYLKFKDDIETHVTLYHNDVLVKTADLSDKVAKRFFVVEAAELGATKTHLAEALNISRQTIHNYQEIKKHFGLEGLIRNYTPSKGATLRQNREAHADEALKGNKARQLEQIRKGERERLDTQVELPFGDRTLDPEDQPFSEKHGWEATRYAGVFTYLITLIHLNNWARMTSSFLGNKYKLLFTFVLMIAKNTRSIEQLKNLHRREAGLILGIRNLPSKTKARVWLYAACKLDTARQMLSHFTLQQIRSGLVGTWLWFVDGHLLPYTGKNKVHKAFNTQRRMMVPGRNNIVACDSSGRVVDFEIQEGKGDIRNYLIKLGIKWKAEVTPGPVMIFDREGQGGNFFYEMNLAGVGFVTWEKNVDTNKLKALDEALFTGEFSLNDKSYRMFEVEKVFTCDVDEKKTETLTIRRVYLWNVSSNRRTCALSNVPSDRMGTEQCAMAILNRWGASENTFKHMGDKHPLNYQPGYSFTESQNQEIANPEVKEIKTKVSGIKAKLAALYKKLTKSKEALNKDGSTRKNSVRQNVLSQIKEKESEVEILKGKVKQLPERVDISWLEDYTCFQRICDESKYLFDIVTASVWNARKQMVEWLLPLYENKNEYVDLFYAITNCHGWIKSDNKKVTVRLEPLQQPSRLAAQKQFCRKLSQLRVVTPAGKLLQLEVGNSPLK